MDKFRIVTVVGARPNFMKAAPIVNEMKKSPEFEPLLLHTGQHYDEEMSKVFFSDLKLPEPDAYLGVGGGTHAEQTARVMMGVEKYLKDVKPNLVIVVGDVNTTLASAISASKLNIPIAHVEAGLRSFDRTMPEEINRIVTDALSNLLFITEKSAYKNLRNEGIPGDKIHFVGNVMIDTLFSFVKEAKKRPTLEWLNLQKKNYALLTLHRPNNVDVRDNLEHIIEALGKIQKEIKIVFPLHPRTWSKLNEFKLLEKITNLESMVLAEPLGYLDFINLACNSKFILTDSGGVQEESTALRIPCLTLRENTERPVTIKEGTNVLVGINSEKIFAESKKFLNGNVKNGKVPKLWDGRASERIIEILKDWCIDNAYIRPIQAVKNCSLELKEPFSKRTFDLLLATFGFVISLPIWGMVGLAIWLEDGGSIFFKDRRVGKGGKLFTAYKFRSMIPDAEKGIGPLQAKEKDPRVTKVGRGLRATAMDELPQLLNIIKGDMSFVGPRALKPAEIELNSKYECRKIDEVPNYSLRTSVRPGLTGIAQIHAPRDINRKNKFRYDVVYVKNMRFWFDIKLIILSFWITFLGKWESREEKLGIGVGLKKQVSKKGEQTYSKGFVVAKKVHENALGSKGYNITTARRSSERLK